MAVPNIFGTATSAIPLSQLDTNFATAITLGNTALYLGNTTTSLGNVTLTNVTISSGNVTITGANVSGIANISTLQVTSNVSVGGNVSVSGNISALNGFVTIGNTTVGLGNTTASVGNVTVANTTVTNYTETVVAIGNSGTSQTLSLTNGTFQTVTMTGNCTFTMPTATAGKSFILICTQDATGSRTAVFTSVKFPNGTAPTLTTTATTGVDILTFVANGTSWFGTYAQAFA
jgi:hypothetical protein